MNLLAITKPGYNCAVPNCIGPINSVSYVGYNSVFPAEIF